MQDTENVDGAAPNQGDLPPEVEGATEQTTGHQEDGQQGTDRPNDLSTAA